jgi:hypothetical protein
MSKFLVASFEGTGFNDMTWPAPFFFIQIMSFFFKIQHSGVNFRSSDHLKSTLCYFFHLFTSVNNILCVSFLKCLFQIKYEKTK